MWTHCLALFHDMIVIIFLFVSVWQSVFCFFFRHLIAAIKIDDTTNKWFDDFYSVCAWVCARAKPIQTSSLVTFSAAIVYRIVHTYGIWIPVFRCCETCNQPFTTHTHSLTLTHKRCFYEHSHLKKRKCTT